MADFNREVLSILLFIVISAFAAFIGFVAFNVCYRVISHFRKQTSSRLTS
jgi:hypothetical protein